MKTSSLLQRLPFARVHPCDPQSRACRDCLVEHFFPWVDRVAHAIARKMNIRDREDAVGTALSEVNWDEIAENWLADLDTDAIDKEEAEA